MKWHCARMCNRDIQKYEMNFFAANLVRAKTKKAAIGGLYFSYIGNMRQACLECHDCDLAPAFYAA